MGRVFRVLTVVGTDHHPFERLVRAVDEWTRSRSAAEPSSVDGRAGVVVDSYVQYGTATAPSHASGSAYLAFQELEARMADATVVVSHGGPSTVVEARRRGIRPIVMPRRAAYGEHVDDHQVRFITRLAESGLVTLVDDADELAAALDRAFADPSSVRLPEGDAADNQAAVRRFAELVAGLFPRR